MMRTRRPDSAFSSGQTLCFFLGGGGWEKQGGGGLWKKNASARDSMSYCLLWSWFSEGLGGFGFAHFW